jgi:hypothetical protein
VSKHEVIQGLTFYTELLRKCYSAYASAYLSRKPMIRKRIQNLSTDKCPFTTTTIFYIYLCKLLNHEKRKTPQKPEKAQISDEI